MTFSIRGYRDFIRSGKCEYVLTSRLLFDKEDKVLFEIDVGEEEERKFDRRR